MTDTQTPAETPAAPVYTVPQERRIVTAIPGPRSQALHERRLAVVSAGVTTVGHTEENVVRAAAGQLQDVIHTLFTITPYEEYVRVAELLAEHTPGTHSKRTVLVNSGAEAVENGVKIARRFTGRRAVAVL